MTRKEVEQVVEMTVNVMAEKFKLKAPEREPEYVTCREAARILGLSEYRMRQLKMDFPHKKVGKDQQGRLLFLKSALIENYTK